MALSKQARRTARRTFANCDPALHETLLAVSEGIKTMHVGIVGLVDLVVEGDWKLALHGIGCLREMLEDLDLNLQTLENGKCDRQ
jgi:hypothetical protein